MGGRLSRPRGPAGTSEASHSLTSTTPTATTRPSATSTLAARRALATRRRLIVLPLAALTLGTLVYVYTTTTVSAAKENARRKRDADGGTISWRREGLRRHGRLEAVQERTLWAELTGRKDGAQAKGEAEVLEDENPIEAGIKRARQRRQRTLEEVLREGERVGDRGEGKGEGE